MRFFVKKRGFLPDYTNHTPALPKLYPESKNQLWILEIGLADLSGWYSTIF